MKVVVGDWVGNVILDLGLILTGFFSVVRALFLSSVVPKCAGSFWLFLALFWLFLALYHRYNIIFNIV